MSLKPSPTFLKAMGLLLVLSLAPVSIYILYNRTGGFESQKERAFQKVLRFVFMGPEQVVDMTKYTEWPWARMCAFTNAVSREDMTAVLGFDYKDYDQLNWLPHARNWTLMFIDTPRDVSWGTATPVTPIRIPRADLADLELPAGVKGVCVPRETGRLVFRRGVAPVGVSPITVKLTNNDTLPQ